MENKVATKELEIFEFLGMEFNVTKAKEMIEKKTPGVTETKVNIEDVVKQIQHDIGPDGKCYYDEHMPEEIKEWKATIGIGIDYKHAKEVKIEGYAILVQFKPEFGGCIIDGWHRIFKCHKEGIKTFKCYALPAKLARKLVDNPKLRMRLF
jgi:hypothetical protein